MKHIKLFENFLNENNELTKIQLKKLFDEHNKKISGEEYDNWNSGSSSGPNWISSNGEKDSDDNTRLTSEMDPKTGKITHTWE